MSCVEIAEATGLEPVQRKGKLRYVCPICNDDGNLSLAPEAKNSWYCHNCQEKGGPVSFSYAVQGPEIYEQYKKYVADPEHNRLPNIGGNFQVEPTSYRVKKMRGRVALPTQSSPGSKLVWQILQDMSLFTPENTKEYCEYWKERWIDPAAAWQACIPITDAVKEGFKEVPDATFKELGFPGFQGKPGEKRWWFTTPGMLIPVFHDQTTPVNYRFRPYQPFRNGGKEFAPFTWEDSRARRPNLGFIAPQHTVTMGLITEGLPDLITLSSVFPEALVLSSYGAILTYVKDEQCLDISKGYLKLPDCINLLNIKLWVFMGHKKETPEENEKLIARVTRILQATHRCPVQTLLTPERHDWNDRLKEIGLQQLTSDLKEMVK
ncbi:hypothetical protein KKD49_18840 [Myxococcota bacterium]|nr:hypothetical protein [Myxococcota bacterium]